MRDRKALKRKNPCDVRALHGTLKTVIGIEKIGVTHVRLAQNQPRVEVPKKKKMKVKTTNMSRALTRVRR